MKKSILFSLAIVAVSLFGSCANDVEMNYPSTHKLSNLPVVEGVHDGVKAPLYWSVYEYCMLQNAKGVTNNFFNDTATTEIYTLSLHDALPI